MTRHVSALTLICILTACGGDASDPTPQNTGPDVESADVHDAASEEDGLVESEDGEVTSLPSADVPADIEEEEVPCTPASVVRTEGVAWGTPCCGEETDLEEVYKPDGCNWCSCVGTEETGMHWECTATICTDDADSGSASPDATLQTPEDAGGPTPDVTVPFVCPPEGSEVLSDPPPETIPDGTCEPQPVATPPTLELGTVAGTEIPSEFLYIVPDNPTGLLIVFHGGGGSKDDAFGRVEGALILNAAVDAGYAVAALDSVAHIEPIAGEKKKWSEDETACNRDIQNVVAMVSQLKDPEQLGLVPEDAPLYAFGVSNGGSMVSRTSQHIDFAAVATYITNAKKFHEDGAHIPPIFIMAGEHDSTVGTTGPCVLHESAHSQGIDTVFKLNVSQAVTPGLFTRIPGVDCAMSLSIVESFRAAGVLDDTDHVAANPGDFDTWLPHLPSDAADMGHAVRDLLEERFAEHSLTSDFRGETVGFFDAHGGTSTLADLPTCP